MKLIENISYPELSKLSDEELYKLSKEMITFNETDKEEGKFPDGFWRDYKNPIRPLVADTYHDSSTHVLMAQNRWYEKDGSWDREIVATSLYRLRIYVNMFHYICVKEGWVSDEM